MEYNSRLYQGYALMPITNLAGFSKNKKVKAAAQDILDHLSEILPNSKRWNDKKCPL